MAAIIVPQTAEIMFKVLAIIVGIGFIGAIAYAIYQFFN
jgi:hypothetical protein